MLFVEEARPGRAKRPRDAREPDLFQENRPQKRTKKRGKSRKKSRQGTAFAVLAVAFILGFAALGVWRTQEYRAFAEMKRVVSNQTFYSGTGVDGRDVSGMTLAEALDYFNTQVEPVYRSTTVTLNDGTQVTAEQLGYSSDYETVLNAAWNAGRSGSLEERYRQISSGNTSASYTVSRSMTDESVVREYAAALAAQVDTEPADASLKSFNVDSYEFEFEAEQPGYTLNQQALADSLATAMNAGGGSVNLEIDTTAPQVTLDNVKAQYGMISYAVTNASNSSSNRLSNIRLALSEINGLCLEPGESFSFNEVVGERTTERGFKMATAYSSGEVTEQVGGGICQVSTTIFNAMVKADMQLDERHSHSLTVSYVDLGKDAAVNWGSQDLRFTNSSDDRVYLCCYLTEDKRVRVGVFGKLLPDGTSIALDGVQTGTIDYTTQYQLNLTLATGETKVSQTGKKGYTAMTYKVYLDANGSELRREELCKSSYKARNEIVEYGP